MINITYKCQFCNGPLVLTGDVCWDKPELYIGKCTACKLVQVSDFSHVDKDHYASDDYLPADLESARRRESRWNRRRATRLRELMPEAHKKKALDFGCGHGGFMEQAQGLFRSLVGYDLSVRVCEEHNARGWACVSSVEDVPGDIDIILLFHVLEHLSRPWELLTQLQGYFPRLETVVIEVPNTDEALNSLFNNAAYRRNHYSADHVYYFTSETLRQMVEFANLEILLDSQMQRYTLANNLGWLSNHKGGGQDLWEFFNDQELNIHYERVLISRKLADSVFFVCRPKR